MVSADPRRDSLPDGPDDVLMAGLVWSSDGACESEEMILLSLDIDGTLEVGDPPGWIPLELIRRAKTLGYIVGSSSDRVVSDQQRLWARHEIEMDFVGHKHKLDEIKARYPEATRLIHIGDGDADHIYAVRHGFEFHWVHEVPEEGSPGWIF